jgi:cobalt/nickel transport protein
VTAPVPTRSRSARGLLVAGVLLAFVLAGFVSGYASSEPDGLEKVAGDQGFLTSADEHAFGDLFLADYAVRGIDDPRLAGGLAGVIGVALVLVVGTLLFWGVARLGRRRPASRV